MFGFIHCLQMLGAIGPSMNLMVSIKFESRYFENHRLNDIWDFPWHYAWTNVWVNKRHCVHYDVIIMRNNIKCNELLLSFHVFQLQIYYLVLYSHFKRSFNIIFTSDPDLKLGYLSQHETDFKTHPRGCFKWCKQPCSSQWRSIMFQNIKQMPLTWNKH